MQTESTAAVSIEGQKVEAILSMESENNKIDDIAEQAYQFLSDLFRRHINDFMLNAGQYIIITFYGGDARKALIKNKSVNGSPSLKLLIAKLKATKDDPAGNAPSLSWFYKAVNLAAHEAICQELGLSTFTILGHSHKLQLLNVPKLKQINCDKIKEAIKPAFEEKDRLAKKAVEENLSVREFVKHIKETYPPINSNITANQIPDAIELRKLPTKKLQSLQTQIDEQIVKLQNKLNHYEEAKARVDNVIEDKITFSALM